MQNFGGKTLLRSLRECISLSLLKKKLLERISQGLWEALVCVWEHMKTFLGADYVFKFNILYSLCESIHIIIKYLILNIGDILIISECPSESDYHYLL